MQALGANLALWGFALHCAGAGGNTCLRWQFVLSKKYGLYVVVYA